MFRYTDDEPRHSHPADVHDHMADAALLFATIWAVCAILGLLMLAGRLS